MAHLYPLRLHAEFCERVWGAKNLAPVYTREITGNPVGEAWLTGDSCKVANGPLTGISLGEISRQFGRELLGEGVSDCARFPLLIKFLFPKDKLSVQVHPDDEAASRLGQPCGKTECWYILQAEPGAQIGLGLRAGTSKAQVLQAIRETRLEQLLNWIQLRAGDLIYVEAGTIHALGPGVVIVEIQQNSDTTYRLYDYGRPRELHIDAGIQATKEWTHAGRVEPSLHSSEDGKDQVNLITSPCFIVDKFTLSRSWEFRRPQHARGGVWCLVAIRGSGVISAGDCEPISFSCGEVVVVPAAVREFAVKPQWEIEFLCSSVPAGRVEHPRTTMETPAAVAG